MKVTPGLFAPVVTRWARKADADLEEDDGGNLIPDFTPSTVKALAAYPGEVLELDSAAHDIVTADMVLLLAPDVTTTALDEWTVYSKRYRVDGDPGVYVHPVTSTAVTRVNLRRIS